MLILVHKNSKVFEQKGDLLNFKADIDPKAVQSRVKPGKLSRAEPSQAEPRAEPSQAKGSICEDFGSLWTIFQTFAFFTNLLHTYL